MEKIVPLEGKGGALAAAQSLADKALEDRYSLIRIFRIILLALEGSLNHHG